MGIDYLINSGETVQAKNILKSWAKGYRARAQFALVTAFSIFVAVGADAVTSLSKHQDVLAASAELFVSVALPLLTINSFVSPISESAKNLTRFAENLKPATRAGYAVENTLSDPFTSASGKKKQIFNLVSEHSYSTN